MVVKSLAIVQSIGNSRYDDIFYCSLRKSPKSRKQNICATMLSLLYQMLKNLSLFYEQNVRIIDKQIH